MSRFLMQKVLHFGTFTTSQFYQLNSGPCLVTRYNKIYV